MDGNRATVGALGDESSRTGTRRVRGLFTVEDLNGVEVRDDRLRAITAEGTTPPDCDDGPGELDSVGLSFVVVTDNQLAGS